jgi:hypothetical protein
MTHRLAGALFVLSLVFRAAIATAQVAAPPIAHQLELAQIIRQAGYECRAVERIAVSPSPDPAFATMRPEVATCSNGKKFLVVKSGRGGVNARPIVRPIPGDA